MGSAGELTQFLNYIAFSHFLLTIYNGKQRATVHREPIS